MSILQKVFLIGFFFGFFLDGTGIVPKEIVFVFLIFLAFFFGIFSLVKKKLAPVGNKWIWILVVSYLLYLFYLSFFSLNIQVSFEYTVFITALLLVFIALFPFWPDIERIFLYGMLVLGGIFSLYSFFVLLIFYGELLNIHIQSNYQYVFSLYGSNHLGEFLVFPSLISLYFYIQKKEKIFLAFFIFFLIFSFFSYSRTGYGGLLIGLLLLAAISSKKLTPKHITLICGSLVGIILFFFITSFYKVWINDLPVIGQLFPIQGKSVFDTREDYFIQGIKGFLTFRDYGVGLGNFEYASKMFTKQQEVWAESSHNIYLDMLTETGTISFILFVVCSIVLLRTIKNHNKSIYTVLLISWLGMVQFDYLYKIHSYLFLFPLFLIGMLHRSYPLEYINSKISMKQYWVVLTCFLLAAFLVVYIGCGLLLKVGNTHLARIVYPLQKNAYTHELENGDVLVTYLRFFPGDNDGVYKKAKMYEREGNMPAALEEYEKSFWLYPYQNLLFAEKIYDLKRLYQENSRAQWFADKVLKRLHNNSGIKRISYEERIYFNKLCQKLYDLHCPYIIE